MPIQLLPLLAFRLAKNHFNLLGHLNSPGPRFRVIVAAQVRQASFPGLERNWLTLPAIAGNQPGLCMMPMMAIPIRKRLDVAL